MSSLSNQPPASPFSEYSELCKVPPMASSPTPQSWDWQHQDLGAPKSLSGVPLAGGLTDEDKLCFFEPPAGGGLDAELKVPGGRGMIPGSGSFLGSTGESPDSPLSSSPSPASPGKFPGSLAGVGNNGVVLPTASGSPIHRHDDFVSSSPSPLSPANPTEWNPAFSASLADPSPRSTPGQQVAPNYCVIGVVNDNYMEGGDAAAIGGRQGAEGSSEDEEEEEVEEDLQPCFMGRAEQQRKAMRRAMSECSHLAVPASLQLPDKYPGGSGGDLDELPSPGVGGPRRANQASMRRSLTVADDQPPTPPPTLGMTGVARSDLRQELDARLHLAPFPPLRDLAGGPLSPMETHPEGVFVDKDEGVLLPVPPTPKAFNGTGGCLGGDANPFAMATEGR